jgi:hypothetical protein
MKNRMLYGWNPRRTLYLIAGVAIAIYAIIAGEWWGGLLGVYFAAMGLFNWGCASGSCGYDPPRRRKNIRRESFEEIKAK